MMFHDRRVPNSILKAILKRKRLGDRVAAYQAAKNKGAITGLKNSDNWGYRYNVKLLRRRRRSGERVNFFDYGSPREGKVMSQSHHRKGCGHCPRIKTGALVHSKPLVGEKDITIKTPSTIPLKSSGNNSREEKQSVQDQKRILSDHQKTRRRK